MGSDALPHDRRNLLSYIEGLSRFDARDAYLWREGVRWRRRTYADLRRRIFACAAILRDAGLRPGQSVLVQGPDGADWVESLLGTFWAGGVAVPLETGTPGDLRALIAGRCGARLLLAPAGVPAPEGVRRIDFGSWGTFAAAAPSAGANPGLEDRAEIIFTSGTTGDPKGVVLTHGNLISDFGSIERGYFRREALVRRFGTLRFLSTLPLSHMFGQALDVFLPLTMGLTIVLVPPRPVEVMEAARRMRAWGLFSVPRVLDLLAAEVRRALASEGRLGDVLRRQEHYADRPFYLQAPMFWRVQRMFGWRFRLIVSGGAALPEAVDLFWRRSGYLVVQGYGMTETAPIVSISNPFDRKAGSVGRPLAFQEVKLGAGNEVLVRGPNVMSGYLGAEPGAAEEGWLRTGDVGEFDDRGRLRIRGRLKEVIVTSEGENVYPADVEAAFAELHGVRDVSVVGLPLEHGERVHAALLLAPNADAMDSVRRANERLLPKQRVRGHTVWLEDDFPRAPGGKVRRGLLRERILALDRGTGDGVAASPALVPSSGAGGVRRLIAGMARVPPETLLESTRLAEGLGFASLDLVELAASFQDEYGLRLPEDRLGAATVGDLERLVRAAAAGEGWGAVDSGSVEGASAQAPNDATPARAEGALAARGGLRMPRWTRFPPVRLGRRCIEEMFLVPFVRFYARPEVRGLERLKGVRPPYLFVPNHRSFMDTGLFKAMLPRPLRGRVAPAMTTRYHRVFFGETPGTRERFLKERFQVLLLEFFFNVWPLPETAGLRASLSYAGELMDEGFSILVFPEGRHVRSPRIDPFRKGIGIFARDLRAPVVPVYIEGTDDVLPERRYWPRRAKSRLTFGAPFTLAPDADASEAAVQIEAAVRRLHAAGG
jgi:long-chain acyl-CoA synthetase